MVMHKSANNQLSSIGFGSMPWWVAAGSQDEQMNSFNLNHIDWSGDHQKSGTFSKSEHINGGTTDKEKQTIFHLSFSTGESKNSLKENNIHDHQTNIFQQFPPPQKSCFELGLGQPSVCANYSLIDQCHGLYTAYGTQPMPYIHESRHRHACRRVRGAGGRFLNTKNLEDQKNKQQEAKVASDQATFPSSHSSSSEVLQSEGGNLNSSREIVSDCKSSEVTSVYYSKEFDCFGINPGRSFSFQPLPNMEGNRHESNWVTANDGCCNFFRV
ncbi:Nuclear transcription factor Y subunit A-2 [Bienertia sinuspersici]